MLVWDPADPDADPVRLGGYLVKSDWVAALAVLPDGRLASSGNEGRVLVWDTADPDASPVEIGRHDRGAAALAALPDGRLATGGIDGRVLVWDPADPNAGSVELGRHGGLVEAVAVLPDGRLVTGGGDGWVWLWDVPSSSPGSLLACFAYALATSPSASGAHLFIGHMRGGISCWEVRAAAQNTSGARQGAG